MDYYKLRREDTKYLLSYKFGVSLATTDFKVGNVWAINGNLEQCRTKSFVRMKIIF